MWFNRDDDDSGGRRSWLRHAVVTLVVAGTLGAAGGAVFVWLGIYNVSALRQHTRPVFALLTTAQEQSIAWHARDVRAPDLEDLDLAAAGFEPYRASCAQCHGAPGVAPDPAGLGMTPVPTNLAQSAREHPPRELYWATRNGLKMTGMPAWEFQYDDDELWEITAFVEQLDQLSPLEYRLLEQASDEGRLDGERWQRVLAEGNR